MKIIFEHNEDMYPLKAKVTELSSYKEEQEKKLREECKQRIIEEANKLKW